MLYFEMLYDEGAATGNVMCIALNPYITGARHLEAALTAMRERDDVWFATGSESLDAYLLGSTPP